MTSYTYANIPGTDPQGRLCQSCGYWQQMKGSLTKYICGKIAEAFPGAQAKPIKNEKACKEFIPNVERLALSGAIKGK